MDDGTYDQDRQPVSRENGYQVGLWTKTIDAGDTERVEHLINEITGGDLMFDGHDMWTMLGGEWGVWTDSDTSEVFIEPCVWFAPSDIWCALEEAFAFGRKYNQRAVWCWATMSEIPIPVM